MAENFSRILCLAVILLHCSSLFIYFFNIVFIFFSFFSFNFIPIFIVFSFLLFLYILILYILFLFFPLVFFPLLTNKDSLDERRTGLQRHARPLDRARTFPGEPCIPTILTLFCYRV